MSPFWECRLYTINIRSSLQLRYWTVSKIESRKRTLNGVTNCTESIECEKTMAVGITAVGKIVETNSVDWIVSTLSEEEIYRGQNCWSLVTNLRMALSNRTHGIGVSLNVFERTFWKRRNSNEGRFIFVRNSMIDHLDRPYSRLELFLRSKY